MNKMAGSLYAVGVVFGFGFVAACASTSSDGTSPSASSPSSSATATAGESEVTFQSNGYDLEGTWRDVPNARIAAVLLQGSGKTDRDETTPPELTSTGKEAKDFKRVTEILAQAGVSSLRFDKRGVREALATPPSLTVWKTISRDLLLQDARSAIAWARARGFERVMILGHSEGTSLALQLAAEPQTAAQIHSIVLIGTVGQPMKDIAHTQFVDNQLDFAFAVDTAGTGCSDRDLLIFGADDAANTDSHQEATCRGV